MRNLSRFLEAKFKEAMIAAEAEAKARVRPSITLSRETGAGAVTISHRLAERMERETKEKWVVLDRELAAEVAKTHNLPERVAQYMVEGRRREATAWIEEFIGLHPPIWTLVEKTNETILRLANTGNVILVGRGAHCVTSRLSNAFHVRLVGPAEMRAERAAKTYNVGMSEARHLIERTDRERRDYVKQNFDRNIEDPLDYHLVINTGRLSDEEVARLVADAVLRKASQAAAK